MPKISIIIPVYGVEKFIERCAVSLFEQTLDDIEYIFVDDCTPDKSIEVLKSVIKRYPHREKNVKILHHENNMGLPYARQTGIKNAIGEYIANCDSDDWVDLELYERMYRCAKSNGNDVVACDFVLTNGSNGVRKAGGHLTKGSHCIIEMMHRKMWWSLCNKIFQKSLFDSVVTPTGAMGEDMALTLQLMRNVKTVGYVNERYYYFINSNSIINSLSENQILSKYDQLCSNLELVFNAYEDNRDDATRKGIDYLNFYKYELFLPLLDNPKYYSFWKRGILNFTTSVLFNRNALLKERIKALLILLSLFPLPKDKYSYKLK